MDKIILASFLIGLFLRFISLWISSKNQQKLLQNNAVEYGKTTTKILALLHITFYLAIFIECYFTKPAFDYLNIIGIGIYSFSILMLYYVIYQLSPFWTVKLFIAKEHRINKTLLFKWIKHPNYYLNIIPELVGLTLITKAYLSFTVIFPIYLIILSLRIKQEEQVMREKFSDY